MRAPRRPAIPAWFPRLTRRGGAFLLAGSAMLPVGLVQGRRDLLFIAGVLMLVPLVALVYITVRPARARATRTFIPAIVAAGNTVIVSLRVRNMSSRPLVGAHWRDTASPGVSLPPGAPLPGLARYAGGPDSGADTAHLEYAFTPRLRGVYSCGPLLLGRHDPFNLAYSESPMGVPHDLLVTPRVTVLPGRGMSITSGDGSLHELLRHMNPNSDELIAREYRPGDPLRRVNWRATARRGEIMVRQEEQRSNPEARIILDTALSGHPESGLGHAQARRHFQAFEAAIELVASVGVHLLDAGFRVQLVELGSSQLAAGPDRERGGLRGDAPVFFRSPGGDRVLLEGLANVVPVTPAAAADAGPAAPGSALAGRVPTFLVLVDIDSRDAAELAALRSASDPAVAFVLDTMDRSALDALQEAGWRCIRLRNAGGIPAAWDEAQQERGAVHDPA